MNNTPDDPLVKATSPQSIVKDVIVSVLILAGTWVVDWLRRFLPFGLSPIIALVLLVGEITLALYFIGVLLRALGWAFRELDLVRESVRKSGTWKQSRKLAKDMIRKIIALSVNILSVITKTRRNEFIMLLTMLLIFFNTVLFGEAILGDFLNTVMNTQTAQSGAIFRAAIFNGQILIILVLFSLAIVSATVAIRFIANRFFTD